MGKYTAPEVGIMMDIESLGLGVRPVITQIAMISFAMDDPETYVREAEVFLPIQPQLEIVPPRHISGSTLGWWMKQNEDARLKISESAEGDFGDLQAWLRDINRRFEIMTDGLKVAEYELIARGPQFDVAAVESLMADCGIKPSWNYAQVRDLRTIMSEAGIGTDDVPVQAGLTPHLALDDCKYQIACWAAARRHVHAL